MNFLIVSTILTVLTLIGSSFGIECYSCKYSKGRIMKEDESGDRNCLVDVTNPSIPIETCPPDTASEKWNCAKTWVIEGGIDLIDRKCFNSTIKMDSCREMPLTIVGPTPDQDKEYLFEVCFCNSDRCNSGSLLQLKLSVFSLMSVLIFLSKFL